MAINLAMPQEECSRMAEALDRRYAAYTKGREFSVESYRDGPGVRIQVTLQNQDKSFYYPIEARAALTPAQSTPEDAKAMTLRLIDYVAIYLDEFFHESEGVFIPIDWAQYNFEGIELQMRGQIHNLVLEKLADDLLSGAITPESVRN